jgi:bifunctional DNase/RNase
MVAAGVVAIAAGCAYNSAPDPHGVRVEVANVGLDKEGMPYVVLEDSAGGRVLPIMIGESEAQGIALELHGLNPGRPLTYDLIRNILQTTGNHVDRVEVNDLRDQTYYAAIFLDHGRHRVDSRPSDAIAVALATNAPIYVASQLFESGPADVNVRAGVPPTVRALGLTVQELSPEMADYFAAQAGGALLIADVSGAAHRAGVIRGDLLTKVDARQVRTLKDFNQDLMRVAPGQKVTLTIERDGRTRLVTLQANGG